jgi:hypothetical protein
MTWNPRWNFATWLREYREQHRRNQAEREGRRQRNRETMPRTRIGRGTHDGVTETFVYYDFGNKDDVHDGDVHDGDCDGGDGGGD